MIPTEPIGSIPRPLHLIQAAAAATQALRAGYPMHLAKPVEPNELTAVVSSLALRR